MAHGVVAALLLTQLVLTSNMISVSTVVSLPCVSHDCIDRVGFDKQHDIGEYCGLITMCFSWLYWPSWFCTVVSLLYVSHECSLSAQLTSACEFQCECCKGVRFPDRCSVDKLFLRACTASSSYSAVPWVICQLCTVCCLTAVATTWSRWVFTSLQCSRVYNLWLCKVLDLVCPHRCREKHADPVSAVRAYGRGMGLFCLFSNMAQLLWAVSFMLWLLYLLGNHSCTHWLGG